jgi:hypothetical protein
VGVHGLELTQKTSENSALSKTGAAESGAIVPENAPIDPDLQAIIERWPDLPPAVKASIAAMAAAAGT